MEQVKLRKQNVKETTISIVGITPLMMNKWDTHSPDRGRGAIRRKKLGQSKIRTKLDAAKECEAATYRLSDGSYGFPASAFRKAMIRAAHKDLGIERTVIRASVFVMADEVPTDEMPLVRLKTPGGKMREDVVRVGINQADLRYRMIFEQWAFDLRIRWDDDRLALETVVNLLNRAGFSVGIGENRPEKDGDFGQFEVVSNG